MAETRKLAAILAADVAGYGKLTGADEERTLARLRALRSDLIDPTIALHHGRVVKRTGDGVLNKRTSTNAIRAESKGREWQREPDEAQEDFQARVVGDLRSAGHKLPFLVILSD